MSTHFATMKLTSKLAIASTLAGLTAAANTGTVAYYAPGLGACGRVNSPNDYVASVSTTDYANGANCGKSIRATYNGKSVTATIADTFPPYGTTHNLDLSPSAFQQLANLDLGQFTASWDFV